MRVWEHRTWILAQKFNIGIPDSSLIVRNKLFRKIIEKHLLKNVVKILIFLYYYFSYFRIFEKMAKSNVQTIDLTKLNLMQLTQFKNQLDQDLQFYQESLQNLKHAQTK